MEIRPGALAVAVSRRRRRKSALASGNPISRNLCARRAASAICDGGSKTQVRPLVAASAASVAFGFGQQLGRSSKRRWLRRLDPLMIRRAGTALAPAGEADQLLDAEDNQDPLPGGIARPSMPTKLTGRGFALSSGRHCSSKARDLPVGVSCRRPTRSARSDTRPDTRRTPARSCRRA